MSAIHDMLTGPLYQSTAREMNTINQARNYTLEFERWIGDKHPRWTWEHLKPHHLREYLAWNAAKGLGWDALRMRLLMLKQAATFAEENQGCVNIAKSLKNPIMRGKRRGKILSWDELDQIIMSMHQGRWAYWTPMLLLQGYCGLRLLEATNIRHGDINIEEETITIAKTPYHTPKNPYSLRTIPIFPVIVKALSYYMQQTVRGPDCVLTPTEAGRPHNVRQGYVMNRRCLPEGVSGRALRRSFYTNILKAGAREAPLDVYVGHAPTTVGRRHYQVMDVEFLRKEIINVVE